MRLGEQKSGFGALRKVIGSVSAVVILVTGGGFILGWWGGPQPEQGAVLAKQTETIATQPTSETPIDSMSVSIESLLTPVPQESNADMTIKTVPGAKCVIKVTYAGVASTDEGLVPKTASQSGRVDWMWTVEPSTPLGTWPVDVTCTHDGQSATAHGSIVVSEPPAH